MKKVRYKKRLRHPRPKVGTSPELTAYERHVLGAIASRIFPATDTPGAVEAGAVNYIEKALCGDYRVFRAVYRKGLRDIDRYSKRKFACSFLEITEFKQDEVLADFESDRARGVRHGDEFFELVRGHVLEGVFGEPSYGGNRNMVGWRLVGFPGQRFGYDDPYINRVVDLPPVAAGKIP